MWYKHCDAFTLEYYISKGTLPRYLINIFKWVFFSKVRIASNMGIVLFHY